MFKFIGGAIFGCVICLAALELLFRWLPVDSGVRLAVGSADHPVTRYRSRQEYVHSKGWGFTGYQKASTNGEGFANSIDKPLPGGILVVGDSYVEAMMLPYRQTLQGRLENALPGSVAAVGLSGNGLADYLEICRIYSAKFESATVVMLIEMGDLRHLLAPPSKGHNTFATVGDTVVVVHSPYVESPLKAILSKSALLRYLYYNLKINEWRPPMAAVAASPESRATEMRSNRQVLAYFFSRLQDISAGQKTRIVFLLDAERNVIQRRGKEVEPIERAMRDIFLADAGQAGFEVIDMAGTFRQHFDATGERLDWAPADYHWTPASHQLAAAL